MVILPRTEGVACTSRDRGDEIGNLYQPKLPPTSTTTPSVPLQHLLVALNHACVSVGSRIRDRRIRFISSSNLWARRGQCGLPHQCGGGARGVGALPAGAAGAAGQRGSGAAGQRGSVTSM